MRRLTDFLIIFFVTTGLCGRGPTVFGLLFALSIPAALLLVLIGVLYPDGLAGFAAKALRTIVQGLH